MEDYNDCFINGWGHIAHCHISILFISHQIRFIHTEGYCHIASNVDCRNSFNSNKKWCYRLSNIGLFPIFVPIGFFLTIPPGGGGATRTISPPLSVPGCWCWCWSLCFSCCIVITYNVVVAVDFAFVVIIDVVVDDVVDVDDDGVVVVDVAG